MSEVTERRVEASTVVPWLREHAIPLAGVEPGQGFDDLAPLKPLLEGVRLVGLGEATHGSREFFQMKHRLVELLVQELGFSAFLLEASYSACWNIDAYVTRGEGDRAEALASKGFWTWDTEEVTELIEWMRTYNESRPESERVRFLGYDIQRLNCGVAAIRDYLERVAPELARVVTPTLDLFWVDDVGRPSLTSLDDDLAKSQVFSDLHMLVGYLATHRTRLVRETSLEEWRAVHGYSKNILRYVDAYIMSDRSNYWAAFAKRDQYMAETVEELMELLGPEARAAVWAHNGHVTTSRDNAARLGAHLRDVYGDAYYTIGFLFNEGSFQARRTGPEGIGPLQEFTVGPAPEGFLEWYFAEAGLGPCFVDLRHNDAPWLHETYRVREIGSGYHEGMANDGWLEVPREYDALIYIPTTTRARPTPSGERPEGMKL